MYYYKYYYTEDAVDNTTNAFWGNFTRNAYRNDDFSSNYEAVGM